MSFERPELQGFSRCDDARLILVGRGTNDPNSLLEGMACGVCCVASDVGGVREVLGDTGVVVADDTVSAFADALLRVLRDRDQRTAMAAAGRARAVALFSAAAMTDATVAAAAI